MELMFYRGDFLIKEEEQNTVEGKIYRADIPAELYAA